MRVLLDNNVHRRFIAGHEIVHVKEIGWDRLQNGELISTAEENGCGAMITGDKNIAYQQNLRGRKICIIVLNSLFLKLEHTVVLAPQVQRALDGDLQEGSFLTIGPKAD